MFRPFFAALLLTTALLLASTGAQALSLAEYQQGRSDPATRDSQDAYLFVAFQGMVWYGMALKDAQPDAHGLYCLNGDQVPGEQDLASLISAEATEAASGTDANVAMESVLIKALQRKFPCS